MTPEQTGLTLICICTSGPFLAGLALGVYFQRRVARLGWPWGVLPARAHSIYQTIQNYLAELAKEDEPKP